MIEKQFIFGMNTLSGGLQNTLTLSWPSSAGVLSPHRYSRSVKTREPWSGRRELVGSYTLMAVCRHWLQAKRILTCGNHIQAHWVAIPAAVHMLSFKPCAQARIEYLRLALPEIWRKPALDSQMI